MAASRKVRAHILLRLFPISGETDSEREAKTALLRARLLGMKMVRRTAGVVIVDNELEIDAGKPAKVPEKPFVHVPPRVRDPKLENARLVADVEEAIRKKAGEE